MADIRNQFTHDLTGTPLADTLDGTYAGGFQDFLRGGLGNDTYFIDHTGIWDTVVEGAGAGIDTVVLTASGQIYVLGENVENARMDGANNLVIFGNGLDNRIEGDDSANALYGGDGKDLLDGGRGSDELHGGYGDDTVDAGPDGVAGLDYGNDVLYGDVELTVSFRTTGNDVLNGNSFLGANGSAFGNDFLVGDVRNLDAAAVGGNDTLNAGAGNDVLWGDALDEIAYGSRGGNDVLNGDPVGAAGGSDEFFGDAGTNLFGRGGNDVINGGAGNDQVWGDAGLGIDGGFGGNDTLNGGDGTDFLRGDGDFLSTALSATGKVYGGVGGNDTLNGGAATDFLWGDAQGTIHDRAVGGNDTLLGGDGDDFIRGDAQQIDGDGRGGNDLLNGGAGHDLMYGDANVLNGFGGNDTLLGGAGDDWLLGDAGSDTGRGGKDVLNGEAGSDNLYGGSGDDNLLGGAGNDRLYGGLGVDRLEGGIGDDLYLKVESNDLPIVEAAGGGNDTVYWFNAQAGATFSLALEVENLVVIPSGNPVTVIGNASVNHLQGGNGADRLLGQGGDDTLAGLGGDDTLEGGAGNDIYVADMFDIIVEAAGAGIDTVHLSDVGTYTLGANLENLTFTVPLGPVVGRGNTLNNVIIGQSSGDTLLGEAGDDTLDGGGDADVLVGGAGNDVYIVNLANGAAYDRVVESAGGGIDTVRLAAGAYAGDRFVLPIEVENVTALAGTFIVEIIGNELNNVIEGNEGFNVLAGGAGNDTLRGGGGNDIYLIEQLGDNAIEGANAGVDTVFILVAPAGAAGHVLGANIENLSMAAPGALNATGNALDNSMTGNGADNRLDGGDGRDTLRGDRGNDTLIGGAADDRLYGGTGADAMTGGLGNDVFEVDSVLDRVIEAAGAGTGTDTIRATFSFDMNADGADADAVADGLNVENLVLLGAARNGTGNGLNNVITGNALNNTLRGLGGNDTLDGGPGGADRLEGGAGNDTFLVDVPGDTVIENPGEGTDLVLSRATAFTLGAEVENLTLVEGSPAQDGTGNASNNVMLGNSLGNVLLGGGGNDTLTGLAGDDQLAGELGADTLSGGEGADLLDGGADADLVNGDAGEDSLSGGAGGDTLNGGADADSMAGDTLGSTSLAGGNDTLSGGAGDDFMYGDARLTLDAAGGADILNGDDGDDRLYGDALAFTANAVGGNDTLRGGAGDDQLYGDTGSEAAGTGGADTLFGDAGADTLYGGGGNDALNGGAGNDYLVGGSGNDTLAGGDGDDLYLADAGDTIVEAAGGASGFDTIAASVSYDLSVKAPNVESIVARFNASGVTMTGTAGNNRLIDEGGNGNTLLGLAGNDTYVFETFDPLDSATDSAGLDTVIAHVNNYTGTPVFTGIETVRFDLAGTTSTINAGSISGAQALQLGGSATSLTLNALPVFAQGVRVLANYTGSVTYNAAAAGDVQFTIETGGTLTLATNAAVVNQTFEIVGTKTVTLGGGLDGVLTLTGTNAALTLNAINELSTSLVLQGYQGALTANHVENGVDGPLSLKLTGANMVLASGAGLEALALVVNGPAASFIDMNAVSTATDITLTDAGDLMMVRLKSDLDASGYTGDIDLSTAVGVTYTAGSGADTLRLAGGGTTLVFAGNLDGADSIREGFAGNSDSLSATFNGDGTALLPVALDIGNIETFNFQSTGAASVLSLEDVFGLATLNVVHAAGGDANLTLLEVNGDVVAQAAWTASLTVELGDGDYDATGSTGADTLLAGFGNNVLRGDGTGSVVTGGNDTLSGGDGNDALFGESDSGTVTNGGNDTLSGGDGDDLLVGDGAAFTPGVHTVGNDILDGGTGDDTLFGDFNTGFNDTIGGDDVLNGGDGNDTLRGGTNSGTSDNDIFVFDTPLGPQNVDTIVDFVGAQDQVRLDDDIFGALAGFAGGTLGAGSFVTGAGVVATQADDFVLYDTVTGALFYDADGAGGTAAVQFATVLFGGTPVALTAADFDIVV